ncbi:hypothetical protein H4R33_001617, partial [Dimargaris cristalligena]
NRAEDSDGQPGFATDIVVRVREPAGCPISKIENVRINTFAQLVQLAGSGKGRTNTDHHLFRGDVYCYSTPFSHEIASEEFVYPFLPKLPPNVINRYGTRGILSSAL